MRVMILHPPRGEGESGMFNPGPLPGPHPAAANQNHVVLHGRGVSDPFCSRQNQDTDAHRHESTVFWRDKSQTCNVVYPMALGILHVSRVKIR